MALASPPAEHPVFGIGQPSALSNLPAGELKERLDDLPGPAQKKALKWLQDFSFPVSDLRQLNVDGDGGVYYVDPAFTEDAPSTGDEPSTGDMLSLAETFALHSKPGATNVLFLDVDGHVIEDTAWNGGGIADVLYARPYDTDANPASFNATELQAIHEIWHRVAEDFATFDVDVTTEEPVSFDSRTGRVLITRDSDENDNPMPHAGADGVAYVGVFGASWYQTYQPALVYFDNLGSGHPPYVAEASAHEFGHNLSLSHDGTDTTGYFQGLGNTTSYVSWAPIMGVGYYRQVTQWSQGEYPNANNPEDDLAIITSHLGSRLDDHGDGTTSASALWIDGNGTIGHTNPETDPNNLSPENKGVIGSRADVDYFLLDAGDGTIDVTVTPAWDGFTRSVRRGANLDVQIQLLDGSGTVLESADAVDNTDATIQAQVAAGVYYLAVAGVGNATVPYSDYGSQGMYFISGQVAAADPNNPPIAENDLAATNEDGTETIAVVANDSDPDGDGLTILSFSNPAHGSCVISGSAINYTPEKDFNGTDSFSYSIGDGRGGTDTANVTITVVAMNDAPTASDDSATSAFETMTPIDVLDNDYDVDGGALSIASVGNPANGSATHDGASVQYTPHLGFSGPDSFTYTITDGQMTDTATVSVSVGSPPAQDPTVPSEFTAADGANGTALLAWADSEFETGYEIQRETRHKKRDAWVGTTTASSPPADATAYTDAPGEGRHRYRIRAMNNTGSSAWTGWTEVTVTGSSGNGGNNNGGGRGKNR
jgi:hypothetical protein